MLKSITHRNNVKVIGNGPKTLMFGHGFGCDQNAWRAIVPAFIDDYRIILFDYVGSGNSDLTAYDDLRYSKLDGYAQDIIDICDELDLEDVIFIGHSVSSMIGLLASKLNPLIFSKIVFIGPSPRYVNDTNYPGGIELKDLEDLLEVMDNNYLGWSRMMAPAIMSDKNNHELVEDLERSFCATDPEIAKKFARVTFMSDNREDLSSLTIPSLTIQGNDDFLTSNLVAEYIHKNTVNNEMVLLESSGHCLHLSHPHLVIRAIKDFI